VRVVMSGTNDPPVREAPPELQIFPLHPIRFTDAGPLCGCSTPGCHDVGKHPAVAWKSYRDNERGETGFGVPTGSRNGIFVVDLDVKGNGIQSFTHFAAGRDLPDTLVVRTPTGGAHIYFALPPGIVVANARAILPGVDIRGEGGYVVGPGSKHKNGGTYVAEDESKTAMLPPPWLLELVVKNSKKLDTTNKIEPIEAESVEGKHAIKWAREYLSREAPIAVMGQDGSGRFYHVCCRLMMSNLPLETLYWLVEEVYNPRCEPPWSEAEIWHKLSDADANADAGRGLMPEGFEERMKGEKTAASTPSNNPDHQYSYEIGSRAAMKKKKATLGDIMADLCTLPEWKDVLHYNDFNSKVVAVNPPLRMHAETDGLTREDIADVCTWFENIGKLVSSTNVEMAIESVSRKRTFNPVQNYLKGLMWDGVARLERVLPDYFNTAAGTYELSIGPRWWISLVARAMNPGCQSDYTLILEGVQGNKKTSSFRAMMPNEDWYAECVAAVGSKDFYENLRGIWLVAFDELDSLSRGEITKVKSALTSTRDHYRKAYGRDSVTFKRSCGFCGSTNFDRYLNDSTGGRRFWPVKVRGFIDVSKIVLDRDQLWAEAFYLWKNKHSWWVDTSELQALCEGEQADRLEVDDWEAQITQWLADPSKVVWEPLKGQDSPTFRGGLRPIDGTKGLTTNMLLEHAIGKPAAQRTPGDSARVGRIMQRLGYERRRISDSSSREWRLFRKN
jgi:predicted P-loop ATPase